MLYSEKVEYREKIKNMLFFAIYTFLFIFFLTEVQKMFGENQSTLSDIYLLIFPTFKDVNIVDILEFKIKLVENGALSLTSFAKILKFILNIFLINFFGQALSRINIFEVNLRYIQNNKKHTRKNLLIVWITVKSVLVMISIVCAIWSYSLIETLVKYLFNTTGSSGIIRLLKAVGFKEVGFESVYLIITILLTILLIGLSAKYIDYLRSIIWEALISTLLFYIISTIAFSRVSIPIIAMSKSYLTTAIAFIIVGYLAFDTLSGFFRSSK